MTHLHLVGTPDTGTAYPPGPLWSWPRPAETPAWLRPGNGPAVEVTWTAPERIETASGLSRVVWSEDGRWLAETPETRDRAWLRERLPGVAFTVHLWPDGMPDERRPSRPRLHLGTVGAHEVPDPLLVAPPDSVRVIAPEPLGVLDAQRGPDADDGTPTYSLRLTVDLARVLRAAASQGVSMARSAVPASVREHLDAARARVERGGR